MEVSTNTFTIRQGTTREDDGLNVLEHFYRPTDGAGLFGVPFSARQRLIAQGFYELAVTSYKSGRKTDSYNFLGHTLHLATQDMFAVQHANVDPHLNFSVGTSTV